MQGRKHQVPRQRSLHRDLRRLLVADFANQNHVRVVAQYRAQPPRERQARLLRNLYLVDAAQLILHRVFDGNDFAVRVIDLVERGVEGRGLAAAGGAGDQDDAVRQLQHAPEAAQFTLGHAQLAHPAQGCVLPQQPQHQRLAMQHRNHRNPDVHLHLLDPDLDAPILRQPLFSNVQVAENLDPGNNRRLEPLDLRRHRHVLQHAVNPVANAELLLERLQMDVRSPQLDRIPQHLVDEADDGRLLRGGVQVGVLLVALIHHHEGRFLVQRAQRIRAHPQPLFHFPLDGFTGGQHRLERQPGQGLERIQPLRCEQAAGGHFHGAIAAPQRQQPLF